MEPPPRSRWWAHELAAVRARLSACDRGGDVRARLSVCDRGGGVPRKGTKRKGSRSTVAAERAKKRRRVLQFRSLSKNKEKASKPPSTSRLHQHMLHMGLLRKQKSSVLSRRDLALRKELEEARDHLLPHENSFTHEIIERMDPSNDMHSSLSRRKEMDSFVNDRSIEVSGTMNYPANTSCEVVRHASGTKDDIFADLPLLESSKVVFQTGGDALPTVIEESFITDQSDPDTEPEAVSFKLINDFDISAQTSPLDDLVKMEANPDKEPICIPDNDATRSYAPTVGIDFLPNCKSTSMAKPHGDMRLKYSDRPALSSYSDMRSKCSSDNPQNGCFDTNSNCSLGINKPGTSSATALSVMRTRTEAILSNNLLSFQGNVLPYAVSQGVINSRTTKNHLSSQGSVLPPAISHARAYADGMTCRSMPPSTSSASSPLAGRARTEPANYKDVPVVKKRTDFSDSFVSSKNHFSYQASVWPSAVSQGVVNTRTIKSNLSSEGIVLPSAVSQGFDNTRTNADEITSCRSTPAKECIPTSKSSGNMCHESRKPLDAFAALSTEKQDSWYSKVHPTSSPASIGLAFMKLPGLERMEISSGNVKTYGNNKLMNEQSLNCQKQQLVSSMSNIMHGQKNIGPCHSETGQTVLDGCVSQDVPRQQQPTMRLMGKTVSVCKRSKDHSSSNMGKVYFDNIITEATPLTIVPCQFPQKRSLPCQDFVIPRSHLNDSSAFVARTPGNTLSGQKTTFNGVHSQRLQPINSASSTAKDCTWNFGSQFVHQAECNKASMVSASSETHVEPHQPPHMASIPRNQQSQFSTPALCRSGDDHNFVGAARNQSSLIPQGLLKSNIKEKYKKSTLLCYDDPSSAPISQPYQISGTKLPSASMISFFDHGSNNTLSRYPSSGPCPSGTISLANRSVLASGRTCTDSPTDTDGRMGAGFANQISNRPACADNVSEPPAKRQVTDRHDFTYMGSNMSNHHSLGWSLDDAVGPRILDFRNNVAGDAAQKWRTEHINARVSSGSVPAVETRWRGGLVAGVKTTIKPGQGLNEHSKLLYPATFSVGNGVNSVVL